MIRKIRDFISRNKVRFGHGYSYISMIAMPLLVVDMFERRFPQIPFLLAFILAMMGVLIIGFLDDKLGFLDAEQSFVTEKNKLLMDGLYKK